eukprot:m51a1_g3263 hypothetical protein (351) ;mRNA; f:197510-198562
MSSTFVWTAQDEQSCGRVRLSEPQQILTYEQPRGSRSSQLGGWPPRLLPRIPTPLDLDARYDAEALAAAAQSALQSPPDTSLEPFTSCLERVRYSPRREGVAVVSFRHNLIKLLASRYAGDPWRVDVLRARGVVHLGVVPRAEDPGDARALRFAFWGREFERSVAPSAQPGSEFCAAFRTRLGPVSLLLAAEIDCTREARPPEGCGCGDGPSPASYVELKTAREPGSARAWEGFARRKLLAAWAQSYLAGVPRVLFGMRDDRGVVGRVVEKATEEIPAWAGTRAWDKNAVLGRAAAALQWIVESTADGARYELTSDGGEPAVLRLERVPVDQGPPVVSEQYLRFLSEDDN